MVESGPYVEYRCQVYVQQSYVIYCVTLGLLLVAALAAAALIIWYLYKKEP